MDRFNRIIDFVKKTGENCVVFDSGSEDFFVVMAGEKYEKMLGKSSEESEEIVKPVNNLSEEGLLDKINKDVANWRSTHKEN